jgi:hypothetical protein
MIETFVSRSGAKSLRIDGTAFHSAYDPWKEARSFVAARLAGEEPATVVLLGEGLGYITAVLRERLPGARLLVAFHSSAVHEVTGDAGDACWHPGCGTGFADFLRLHVTELDVEGLKVLEWPPSASRFPDESLRMGNRVRETVRELAGNLVTTAGFGRRWLRNTIANWLSLENVVFGTPCRMDRAVLIAASGPTLSQALPAIQAVRRQIDLWALPSAVEALASRGLRPDLVVMTDAGHWSAVHLHHAPRGLALAMPLSAATGTWSAAAATFLLRQPTFFERGVLSAAGLRAPEIQSQGTVTATALSLALGCTEGEVVLAGQDFCFQDLEAHVRPNAFDTLLLRDADRLSPLHARCFRRAMEQAPEGRRTPGGTIRFSPPMKAYADWFSRLGPAAARIFRLFPSAVPLPSLRTLDGTGLRGLVAGKPACGGGPDFHPASSYPPWEARARIASELLRGWSAGLRSLRDQAVRDVSAVLSDRSAAEIAYFLDPRGILELRRALRKSGPAEARDRAVNCLTGGIRFLDSVRERYLGDAAAS